MRSLAHDSMAEACPFERASCSCELSRRSPRRAYQDEICTSRGKEELMIVDTIRLSWESTELYVEGVT